MRDPVCGMTVSTEKNAGSHSHEGTAYLFCSSKCREKFMTDPETYLYPQPKKSDPAAAAREYTYPMHPDIVQQGPGRSVRTPPRPSRSRSGEARGS